VGCNLIKDGYFIVQASSRAVQFFFIELPIVESRKYQIQYLKKLRLWFQKEKK
jgi:hypothetical protein